MNTPPANSAILDLANTHAGTPERAVYHFTKRQLLGLARELLQLAPASPDSARLDALAGAVGFIHGTSAGAPAYRVLGNDSWHPDLRAAIDDSQRAKAIAAKEDQ